MFFNEIKGKDDKLGTEITHANSKKRKKSEKIARR